MIRRWRWAVLLGVTGLAACQTREVVVPPAVVATLAPPPPALPVGAYPGMEIPIKRTDGRYVTPNIDMSDSAAVWHLRGALNVAALACDAAGGSVVDPYNAWLRARGPVLDRFVKQYTAEWERTGWSDWRDAYDNAQTRLYNFYGRPPIRIAFCQVAREELATVAAVPDAELPTHARGALARLDKPFIDFFTAFDAWRATQPVAVPTVMATVPVQPAAALATAPAAAANASAGIDEGGEAAVAATAPAISPAEGAAPAPRLEVPAEVIDTP